MLQKLQHSNGINYNSIFTLFQFFQHSESEFELKRSGLDKEDANNYPPSPISSLPFISKFIEKGGAKCTEEHLEHIDLHMTVIRLFIIEVIQLKLLN